MTTKQWIAKYPFLMIKCNDTYPEEEVETTWLAELPPGWINGFCEQMCDELMEALGDFANEWMIIQVKEKYARLEIYHNGLPWNICDNVESIIRKYQQISYNTCCVCGKEATNWSKGWILPYCEEHYNTKL